jgi:Gpi18-like mannosyltransferase
LLSAWNNWDALRFIQIAQYSYTNANYSAFFPLFPMLIKAIAWLCGNQGYAAIGMLLSNAALLVSLFILYQLASDLLGERVGRRTLLYLCIFPTAFFFFAAYNEAFFLLLTSATFLALRRRNYWLAGLIGLLAALTRSAGILLVIPFLAETWQQEYIKPSLQDGVHLRKIFIKTLPVVFIPLGMSLYCLYCLHKFGSLLEFAEVQINWGRSTTWPWTGLFSAFYQLFIGQKFGSFYEAHILLDLAATLAAIYFAALSWRKLPLSFAIWISLLVFLTLCSAASHAPDPLVSNQRFILEMFPAFFLLAELSSKRSRLHNACLIAFPFFQALLAALFVLNRWMV